MHFIHGSIAKEKIDYKVLLRGGGPTRGENIDRPLKAIIELFSQYRKISIWSPQYRHIDDVF